MEQQLRFAVHGLGNPVASPRSHGVPRRDIPGRVHISMAGVSAGGAPEDGLALARLRVHLPARRAPLARERRFDPLTRPGAFSSRRRTSRPHPDRRMPRFSPALARTFRPGSCGVPLADRVMFLMRRSSTLIRSNRRARLVLAFSAQSFRRSVSRAFNRAMASRTRPRRFEPCRVRASLRSNRRMRLRSRAVRPTTCSNSPVDSAAATATPRSMPTTCSLPGARTGSGMTAKATCQRPARSMLTR